MLNVPFLNRQALCLRPDPSRVLVRPFKPAVEPREHNRTDEDRAHHIIDRVMAMDAAAAGREMADVLENFEGRHRDLLAIFEARAGEIDESLAGHTIFSRVQRQIVGAYFLHEYSFESAALFNPSIVPHPDQTDVPAGALRFVLSLRAVGEGHVSSLTFRAGMISAQGAVSVEPTGRLAMLPRILSRMRGPEGDVLEVAFGLGEDISERVIFPITDAQANGIEDARFVAFEDCGRTVYTATYTAYSGRAVRSELIETSDFIRFRMTPLLGAAARNKGMALFPRRINGRYAMIGRQDNENLYLIYSDDLHAWHGGEPIMRPLYPWEFVQIGNCGSPIEIDEGWLLFTHGVGPVRRYAIGAVLLDRDDPTVVLGRSREPLVCPDPFEREGYVPNVVYSCGAIRHGDLIILPYAVSDTFSSFATLRISDLVADLLG